MGSAGCLKMTMWGVLVKDLWRSVGQWGWGRLFKNHHVDFGVCWSKTKGNVGGRLFKNDPVECVVQRLREICGGSGGWAGCCFSSRSLLLACLQYFPSTRTIHRWH